MGWLTNFLSGSVVKNIIHNTIWLIIGLAASTGIFFLSANPVSSTKIIERLNTMTLESARTVSIYKDIDHVSMDVFSYQKVGLDASESVVAFGTLRTKEKEIGRWIGVFEPKEQGVLDKIVGRSGFFKLSYIGFIPISSPEELVAKNIDVKDFDFNGVSEFVINLESQWGDSKANGFLIAKKNSSDLWNVSGLPDMEKSIQQSIDKNIPEVAGLHSPGKPYIYFGDAREKRKPLPGENDFNQDVYSISSGSKKTYFSMLRNAGVFTFVESKNRKNIDIATLAFIADDKAVLSSHYSAVTLYVMTDEGLKRDINWNWGYSMLSATPIKPANIDLNSIIKAGIEAHTIGNISFSYTSFERLE
jgi:hypothetical protein